MMEIERVQTGIRIEKRLLKVLKALAELKDLSLGDLLEGMVLHEDGRVSCGDPARGGGDVRSRCIGNCADRAAGTRRW